MKNLIQSDVIVGDGARDVKVDLSINAVLIDGKMTVKHVDVTIDYGRGYTNTTVKCCNISSAIEYMDRAVSNIEKPQFEN